MGTSEKSNFNNVIREIIKNSLFTERQIEIILNKKNLLEIQFDVSRGAYYRELGQSRRKLMSFFYTVVLLKSLDILIPDHLDVMSRLSEQISVIKSGDVLPEREEEVMLLIDRVINQVGIL